MRSLIITVTKATLQSHDQVPLPVLLVPVILIWGCNFAFIRTGVTEVGPFTLGAMRFAVSSFPFLFFVSRPAVPASFLALYALTFGLAQFGCLFVAIGMGLPTGIASLLIQLQAVFTPLFAYLILRQGVSRHTMSALLICLIGLLAILSGQTADHIGLMPLFLGVAAAVFWGLSNALVSLGATRGYKYDPLSLVVWSSLMLPLPFVAMAYGTGEFETLNSIKPLFAALPAALYLGAMATIVAYYFWIKALSAFPAASVTPFSLLVPTIGIAVGYLIFDERLTWTELCGSLIVIAGVVVHIVGMRAQTLKLKIAA